MLPAQELREQPTPFSLWLDFQTKPGPKVPGGVPIWFESVQKAVQPGQQAPNQSTTLRIRLRPLGGLTQMLQMRLFFDDRPGMAPVITGWSETGAERFRSQPLGSGLNLPASETLLIPAGDIDYLEINVPGNGANLRGAFLASLKKAEVFHALDFEPPAALADPFGADAGVATSESDQFLFGRVKATLEATTVLAPATEINGANWEFELESVPMLAMASFEVTNANPLAPPELVVNGRVIGAASLHLPDLADPAYLGLVRPDQNQLQFAYAGWLRAQCAIPGAALRAGLNKISLRSPGAGGALAVRALELQLKHDWKYLDYKVLP